MIVKEWMPKTRGEVAVGFLGPIIVPVHDPSMWYPKRDVDGLAAWVGQQILRRDTGDTQFPIPAGAFEALLDMTELRGDDWALVLACIMFAQEAMP